MLASRLYRNILFGRNACSITALSQPRIANYRFHNGGLTFNGRQTFATSPALCKKKDSPSKAPAPTASGTPEDPMELSELHDGIATALSRLKDELAQLRMGGLSNTQTIESLRVQLGKESKEILKLGDLAQVIPKGKRMLTILAGEEDHIKPITSAILSSDMSLTPQQDPHNPLQLNITIPPPTKESRDRITQSAKVAMEKAVNAIRDSRSLVHKRLQDMQKKKIARPDDVRKARDQMDKVTEKGQKEAKALFETSKNALQSA